MQDPGSWLVPLENPICANSAAAGGKASQLHALIRAEFPVPPAWVVTRGAFESHLPRINPLVRPARPQLDPALAAQLGELAATLCDTPESYLAVRSSALSEDGVEYSYAGQHATYYYIKADTLTKAVIDCWLSLWSQQALSYREHAGTTAPLGMAVIVQQMVQADRAGVCFTVDPTDPRMDPEGTRTDPEGTRLALIEAAWGLGAALVDGRVSPDRYWLDDDNQIVQQHIGHKRLKVAENLHNPTQARLEPVPVQQRSAQVLTADEAIAVVTLARRAEALFAAPQDVEWAFAGGTLYILQSRPVTALATDAQSAPIEGRWVLFKPLVENLSGPLTPLTVDIFRRVLPPFGQFIHGRLYLNADVFSRLLPVRLSDEELLNLLLLRPTGISIRVDWRRLPAAVAIFALGYLASGVTWHRTGNVPLSRLGDFAGRCRKLLDDGRVSPLAALQQLTLNRNPFLPISHLAFQNNIGAGRHFLLISLLNTLLARFAPRFDATKLAILTSGGEQMLSRTMVEQIQELAAIARLEPVLLSAGSSGAATLQKRVLELDSSHPFVHGLDAFLEKFGHRAIGEIELMNPRWREDSSVVLQMISNYLQPGGNREKLDSHGLFLATRDELHQATGRRWQRWLIDALITRIRYFVTVRENTRYYHTMAFATVRAKLKNWEESLIDEQRLRCPDDIFFLEWPQLCELRAGKLDWRDVEASIGERRRRYRRQSEIPPRDSFNLSRSPVAPPGATQIRTGHCASPGIAEGVARVIVDPALGVALKPGEILVAPYTDPAWTPLFPGAAAIVVEIGSYLSHAGVVAREYQIPCLVDVLGITRRVRSGQRLRVNATDGWLEILDAAE
jgi:pyruvate,water dikinase